MPYTSAAQRAFLHARHPKIAAKWDDEICRGVSRTSAMKPKLKTRVQRGEPVTMDGVEKAYAAVRHGPMVGKVVRPRPKRVYTDPKTGRVVLDYRGTADPRVKEKLRKALEKPTRQEAGSAAIGAGAIGTTLGIAGGGIPGRKATKIGADMETAPKGKKVKTAAQAYQAGHFGMRENAHRTLIDFELRNPNSEAPGKTPKAQTFIDARKEGKIPSERKIVRHMRNAKRGSNALLVGGAGLTATGAYLKSRGDRSVKKAADPDDKYALLTGAGATTAAGAGGLNRLLTHQGKKWARKAESSFDAAGKAVPPLGIRSTSRSKPRAVPDVKPALSGKAVTDNPEVLKPYSAKKIAEAARHHGDASQARYFANTYGNFGRAIGRIGVPAGLAAAGVGVGVPQAKKKLKARREGQVAPVAKKGSGPEAGSVSTLAERRTAERQRLSMNAQEKAAAGVGAAAMLGGTGVLLSRYAEPTVAQTKAKLSASAGQKASQVQAWAKKKPKAALATGLGLKGVGVAGLMTARNRKQEGEGVSYGIANQKVDEHHRQRMGKRYTTANTREFAHLPENVRALTRTRNWARNPISPLDMYAGSKMMARFMSGSPVGRRIRKPNRRDVDRVLAYNMGRQMVFSPLGRGAVQGM